MNRFMISVLTYTKQMEDGTFKRVKEQFLIPGETYSTAESFVFEEVARDIKGEVILDSLKREAVEDIFLQDDAEVFEGWYKCKVGFQDSDSEKIKTITNVYYVNADSVASADKVLKKMLHGVLHDLDIKSITLSPIVDVFLNKGV